jgi:hypothetical protein
MQVWKVALLLNVALAVGLGLGYAGWGRRTEALEQELDALRPRVERLERERQACAAGARAGEQQWEGRGVVRAVYPLLVVITHEEIRGLLSARTTGFPRSALTLRDHIQLGDAIRFSLRGTAADDVTLVAIAPW